MDTLFFNWYDLFYCTRPLILRQLCLLLLQLDYSLNVIVNNLWFIFCFSLFI